MAVAGRRRLLLILALSIWAVAGAVYTLAQTTPAEPASLPTGRGDELTRKLCASCHPIEHFNGLRRSASEWDDTVAVMVAYGAPIEEDQARDVVRYLANVFGPASPPLVDANRAARDHLAKLPGMDPAAIERLLTHRRRQGEFKNLKQVQDLLGADKFDRVKGYLTVRQPPGAESHRP